MNLGVITPHTAEENLQLAIGEFLKHKLQADQIDLFNLNLQVEDAEKDMRKKMTLNLYFKSY